MKTLSEIKKALDNIPPDGKYSAMSYEQGIEEALQWVLGEIDDEEFPPMEVRP